MVSSGLSASISCPMININLLSKHIFSQLQHTYIHNLSYEILNLAPKIFLQTHMTTKSINGHFRNNNSKVIATSINQ